MDDNHLKEIFVVCIFSSFLMNVSSCPMRCLCKSNQTVSCAGTNQTIIPTKDIPEATRLLDLQRNSIELIREGDLTNLLQLEELVLMQNRLYEIEVGAFIGLVNLSKIFLDDNELTVLPPGLFETLTKLEVLHLGGNRFSVIPRAMFGSIPSLRLLFIDYNQPDGHLLDLTIESEAFSGLENLEVMSLRSSQIKRLPSGTFSGLLKINQLDLSYNHLNALTRDVTKDLASLQSLKLNSNLEIMTINPGIFEDLKDLIDLDISSCDLSVIDKDMFKGLISLRQLYISGNNLQTVNAETFCESPNLLVLELDRNPLEHLNNRSFDCLTRLGYLNLNHTKLSRVTEGVFEGLHKLAIISLSDCAIADVSIDTFQNKSSLVRLDLNNNAIEMINSSIFDGSPNIKSLRLQNNRIRRIQENVFSGISGSLDLSLKGNPLVCDCQLDWIPGWLMRTGGNLDRCECDQPPALHGIHLDRIPYENFHCKPYIDPDLPQVFTANQEDKRFELVCPIYAKPPPVISWTTPTGKTVSKTTVPDYDNGLYRVRENDTLVIREITTDGHFTCEGRNVLGHVTVEVELVVTHPSQRWLIAFLAVMMVLFTGSAITLVVVFMRPKRKRRRQLTRAPARRVDPRYGPLSPIAEAQESEEL